MNEFDGYSVEIIKYLLSLSRPISAELIGAQVGMSPRSVRYRLKKAQFFLNKYKIELITKPNFGIHLKGDEENLIKLGDDLSDIISLDKDERLEMIKIMLLTSNQPWTYPALASYLQISRSTVISDTHVVKNWFKAKDLDVISKQNAGTILSGDEATIRDLIVQIIYEGTFHFHQEDVLMKLCFTGRENKNPSRFFVRFVQNYFQQIDFVNLNNILNVIFENSLSDSEFFRFILNLAVQIKRILDGYFVGKIADGLGDLHALDEYYKAKFYGGKMETNYRVSFTLDEISHTTRHLMCAKAKERRRDLVAKLQQEKENYADDLPRLIDSFINCLSKKLHPSLLFDKEFKDNLLLHLELFKEHQADFVDFDTRLENEIIQTYPNVYRTVGECVSGSNLHSLQLPNFEKSFLTIHTASALERLKYFDRRNKTVLLVCNTGAATAELLKTKITTEFPDIMIDAVISYKELLKRNKFIGIDYIISTFPMHLFNAPPILIVSPLLQENDIGNLQQAFRISEKIDESNINAETLNGESLDSLVDLDLIALKVQAATRGDAIEKAAMILLEKGYIERRYIEAIKNVIEEYGPFMVVWPGVALLHAPGESGARQSGMSLITLEKPLKFGHEENDPVDIVICLSIPCGKSIALALNQLNDLLTSEESLRIIRSTVINKKVMQQILKFCC